MNYVFLMDPLSSVKMEKDTTFILMHEAHQRGHKTFYLLEGHISRKNGTNYLLVREVIPQKDKAHPFIEKDWITLSEDEVAALFIRTDPPFDQEYLFQTWLCDLMKKTVVVNNPAGIRSANEKLWATQFTSVVPPTLISAVQDELMLFLEEYGHVIAKPTDGFGGQSVFSIDKGDSNARVILETLTQSYSREIVLQEYVPQAKDGDKRILLLNGEPLGAVLRVHAEGEHRNNFFSGGKPVATEITDRDKEIIETIKPALIKNGLYFVGIDILGDYLIEINVTSPTCLQEMNRLYGQQLEAKVIDFVEGLIKGI